MPDKPALVNISLGGPRSIIANAAVTAVVRAGGLSVIASAGNDAGSCMDKSPSSSISVIAVSGTDTTDAKPYYANFGPCIKIFAPCHQITTAWIRDPHDAVRLSGTSMAAPHVSGGKLMGSYLACDR
jgi:subtilisin family serine protease